MKIKTVCSVLAAAAVFILAGCGSSSPGDVAKKWCAAIASSNLNAANDYSTPQMKKMNGMIIGLCQAIREAKPQPEGALIDLRKATDLSTAKIINEKINGDGAVVEIQDGRGNKGKIGLLKINGEWKINSPL